MIAVRNADVAFVVSLAGPALEGHRLMSALVERTAEFHEATDPELAMLIRQEIVAIELALAEAWEPLGLHLAATILAQLETLPDDMRERIGDLEEAAKAQAQIAVANVYQNPWFQFYIRHDPALDWSQVQAPVLAIFGEYDESVPPDLNVPPLQAALQQAGNREFSVIVLPDTNHLFLREPTSGPAPALGEMHVVPELLDALVDWLVQFVD